MSTSIGDLLPPSNMPSASDLQRYDPDRRTAEAVEAILEVMLSIDSKLTDIHTQITN